MITTSVKYLLLSGMSRVYNSCDESPSRTVQNQADHSQGDREDGQYHTQEVQLNPSPVEAVNLRGRDDPTLSLFGCKAEAPQL